MMGGGGDNDTYVVDNVNDRVIEMQTVSFSTPTGRLRRIHLRCQASTDPFRNNSRTTLSLSDPNSRSDLNLIENLTFIRYKCDLPRATD